MTNEIVKREYPEIGEVSFRRSRKTNRLSIKVDRRGKVMVVFPYHCQLQTAEAFLIQHTDWVMKRKNSLPPQALEPLTSGMKTHFHELQLVAHQKFAVYQNGATIILNYPACFVAEDIEVQSKAKEVLEKIYRSEAQTYLPQQVAKLASKHGFNYKRVTVRKSKTRWGSCSSVNNINLSIYLMKLPMHLIDYVILHELCHTVEKNHGKGFWAMLDKVTCGRAKELAKETKCYSVQ